MKRVFVLRFGLTALCLSLASVLLPSASAQQGAGGGAGGLGGPGMGASYGGEGNGTGGSSGAGDEYGSEGGYGGGGYGEGGGYGGESGGYGGAGGYGGEGGGYGGGGYGGGGEGYGGEDYDGGGYGGGGYGGDYPAPPKRIVLSGDALSGKGFEERVKSGNTEVHADRILAFRYRLGTLRPTRLALYNQGGMMGGAGMGGYGGPGMGPDDMGGLGMGPGMGDGGNDGGMDGPGGMYGGGYGGMGGGMGAPGDLQRNKKNLIIFAYINAAEAPKQASDMEKGSNIEKANNIEKGSDMEKGRDDEQAVIGRERVFLVVQASKADQLKHRRSNSSKLPLFDQFEASIREASSKGDKVRADELTLISQMIRQSIWKESAIQRITSAKGTPPKGSEELLGAILGEEYDTQIARQEFEIAGIESRVKQLRAEVGKRKAAKQRVVDVKLGRIVLEAQGLLKP